MEHFTHGLDEWFKSMQEVTCYWPKTPKELLEKWMKSIENLQFLEIGPAFLTSWLKSQRDLLENWGKSQREFLETWMQSTKNFQQAFLDMAELKEGSEASKFLESWFSTFTESCKNLANEMNNIQDTWKTTVEKQMETSGEMAKKFFEILKLEREK
jgi:hypothetical protein